MHQRKLSTGVPAGKRQITLAVCQTMATEEGYDITKNGQIGGTDELERFLKISSKTYLKLRNLFHFMLTKKAKPALLHYFNL